MSTDFQMIDYETAMYEATIQDLIEHANAWKRKYAAAIFELEQTRSIVRTMTSRITLLEHLLRNGSGTPPPPPLIRMTNMPNYWPMNTQMNYYLPMKGDEKV
jgi:hypothetical protein